MALTTFPTERVRRYYERHTRTFIAFGEGGELGAMHRAVFGPGVRDKSAAFRYVDDLIVGVGRQIADGEPLGVIDLGCGVGGSLCYLAQHLPMVGTGITISSTQARLARQRVQAQGLSSRIEIIVGDYTALPVAAASADLVFAVESFVHAPDARTFFAECARVVRPGGAMVICDDFRRDAASVEAIAAIERFRRGWHINTLLEPATLHAVAATNGFAHRYTTDLTAYIDIGRPRDRLVQLLAGAIERLPWRWSRLDPWLGGSALQTCLGHAWLGYDFVVFLRDV